jgi:hypothetical protein
MDAKELNPTKKVTMPITNLNEVMHVAWWLSTSNGKNLKTNFYFATMHDML